MDEHAPILRRRYDLENASHVRVLRPEDVRPAQSGNRIDLPPAPRERCPETEPSGVVIGIERDSALERHARRLRVATAQARKSEIQPTGHPVGTQQDDLLEPDRRSGRGAVPSYRGAPRVRRKNIWTSSR